jgi:hypothetical protein
VGSGAYPQVGETWIIDQSLGAWTFLSRLAAILPQASDVFSLAAGLEQLGIIDPSSPDFIDQMQVSTTGPPNNPKLGQQYYDENEQASFVWNGTYWMETGNVTPIGGVIYSNQWPAVATNYPSGVTTSLTATVNLVQGWQYAVTLTCMQATQITAASASTVQVYMRDSSNFIPASTGLKAFILNSLALGGYAQGAQTIPMIPTADASDVFTVSVQTGASSLQITPSCLALLIVRTA